MAWVFVKFLFQSLYIKIGRLFAQLIGVDTQLDPNCYSFGRFVLHSELPVELFGFLFASFHIMWRLAHWRLSRPFKFDVFLFMMQPEEKVRRFIEKLHSSRWHLSDNELTKYERFLCNIMCYQVSQAHKQLVEAPNEALNEATILHKLRPNRTLEAHTKLIGRLAKFTIWSTIIMATLTCLIGSRVNIAILLNQRRYLRSYPNCDQDLARQQEQGNLSLSWSLPRLSGRPHYAATVLFDSLENTFVWLDSGLALIWGLTLLLFLNKDLQNHWSHLRDKIQRRLMESRDVHWIWLNESEDTPEMAQMLTILGEEMYELQAEVGDFFDQIKQVDLLVSDVNTQAMVNWLGCFICMSIESTKIYSSSGHDIDHAIVTIVGLCSCIFLSYIVTGSVMLSLQRSCRSAYTNLCSLMAHDLTRYKMHFMDLLDYYTTGNRTCYTFLQQFPLNRSNFASIVVWSVSCFIILDSVSRRR